MSSAAQQQNTNAAASASQGSADPRLAAKMGMSTMGKGAHTDDSCSVLMFECPTTMTKTWKTTILPGACGSIHSNECTHCCISLSGGSIDVCDAEGKVLESFNLKAGDSMSYFVNQDTGMMSGCFNNKQVRIPKTHCVRNKGTAPYVELTVELCGPGCECPNAAAASNSGKA